jgi:protein involved in sex pheromone biosynthesis
MARRSYDFAVPVTVPGYKLHWGLSQYKADPVYQRLPASLRQRLEIGEAYSQDVVITKQDLDRIPLADIAYIRQMIGV